MFKKSHDSDASVLQLHPKPIRFLYVSSQSLTAVFGTVTAVFGTITAVFGTVTAVFGTVTAVSGFVTLLYKL